MLTVAGQRRTCDRSHRLRLSIVLELMLSLDLPGIKAPKLFTAYPKIPKEHRFLCVWCEAPHT